MGAASTRRSPGQIRDAILEFLRERRGDVTVADIRRGVESIVGGEVAASSVRSYLNLNEGTLFERTSRGRYRLKR